MKKTLIIFSIILILNSCGEFEFVHKTNINDFYLKNNTNIDVEGDGASQISVLLNNIIGENQNDNPKYKILAKSLKKVSTDVINKDATASKFNIEYSISYNFYNLSKNCTVFNKKITTKNSYNVKSAGYSFGTDLSQKESNMKTINKNINEFISFLNTFPTINKCI